MAFGKPAMASPIRANNGIAHFGGIVEYVSVCLSVRRVSVGGVPVGWQRKVGVKGVKGGSRKLQNACCYRW